ncbi:hypothetical protein [Bacteroides nordii]|uniref:hypothetical protein n=1 Tax=Bacteroides nordii TaxID=291645 RepID=UPI0002D4462C|nr:hypothetical protein [Bacteroides nordii]
MLPGASRTGRCAKRCFPVLPARGGATGDASRRFPHGEVRQAVLPARGGSTGGDSNKRSNRSRV